MVCIGIVLRKHIEDQEFRLTKDTGLRNYLLDRDLNLQFASGNEGHQFEELFLHIVNIFLCLILICYVLDSLCK